MTPGDRIRAAIERVREFGEKGSFSTEEVLRECYTEGGCDCDGFLCRHWEIGVRAVLETNADRLGESRTLLPRMAKALEFAVSLLGQGLDDIDRRDRERELADILDGEER